MPRLGHGEICHIALPAQDVAASAAFYEEHFGWRTRRSGPVVTFDDGVDEVSGHFVPDRAPSAPGPLIYVMVDDLAVSIARLQASGVEIVAAEGVDPGERTAWIRDPGGNVIGVYQEPESS